MVSGTFLIFEGGSCSDAYLQGTVFTVSPRGQANRHFRLSLCMLLEGSTIWKLTEVVICPGMRKARGDQSQPTRAGTCFRVYPDHIKAGALWQKPPVIPSLHLPSRLVALTTDSVLLWVSLLSERSSTMAPRALTFTLFLILLVSMGAQASDAALLLLLFPLWVPFCCSRRSGCVSGPIFMKVLSGATRS